MHVAACVSFGIDLSVIPHTSYCIKNHPKPREESSLKLEGEGISKRYPEGTASKLNPKGYR